MMPATASKTRKDAAGINNQPATIINSRPISNKLRRRLSAIFQRRSMRAGWESISHPLEERKEAATGRFASRRGIHRCFRLRCAP